MSFSSKLVLQHFPGIFILLYFTFTHFYPWILIYYESLYQINTYGKIHFVSFTSLHLKFLRNNFLAPNSWSIIVMFVIFLSTFFFLHLLLHARILCVGTYNLSCICMRPPRSTSISIFTIHITRIYSPLGIISFYKKIKKIA